MKRPFPGMDPWLEHPGLWPDVHQSLITYGRDRLQEQVGEGYYVAIGERLYLETPERSIYPDTAIVERRPPRHSRSGASVEPDRPVVLVLEEVERREVFLEIRDSRAGDRIVTVIEVLSPANKRPGPGRDLYLRKQAEVLESPANLVEVDLLRGGQPTVALPEGRTASSTYRVVVSRAGDRTRRELYACSLADRLPRVAVPLAAPDADVTLDLPAVLDDAWRRGAYARRLDYDQDPLPPLGQADQAWARERSAAWRRDPAARGDDAR